jgi:transposase-like protein
MQSAKGRTVTRAQRGQIVQRVIVDGWTSAEAAIAFDVEPRLVAAWVADYRRHGMASLRQTPKKTVGAEIIRLRVSLPVRLALSRIFWALRRWLAGDASAARLSPQRRSQDDSRGS